MIVLDVYAATRQEEYSDDARQATNILGMKFSKNKLEAIKVSAPQSRWKDLLLGLPLYHTRYSELTREDFQHFPWTKGLIHDKGSSFRYGSGGYSLIDVSKITERAEIYEKEVRYLRKIIELCQNENLPLVLIKTPTVKRDVEQPYYNSVQDIADEYGVAFYNMNLMDAEIGFTETDYWTDGAHLNTEGARKVSDWLGRILKEEYHLEDQRLGGDSAYDSWNQNVRNIRNGYLKEITEAQDYFEELSERDLTVFLIKNSSWEMSEEFDTLLSQMTQVGIDKEVVASSGGGDWILDSTQSGSLTNQYFADLYSEFSFDGIVFSADFKDGTGIRIDGKQVADLDGPGIICVIYEKETNACIDAVNFLVQDNFQLTRNN